MTPRKYLPPVPAPHPQPGPKTPRDRATPCPYCQKLVPKSELDGSYPFDGCEQCYWEFFD